MIGIRSGTLPISPSGCDIYSADRSWFGSEVGKGDTEEDCSDGVETGSVRSSGVGAAHVPKFLEVESSKVFGLLLASFADDRDNN